MIIKILKREEMFSGSLLGGLQRNEQFPPKDSPTEFTHNILRLENEATGDKISAEADTTVYVSVTSLNAN